MFDADVLTSGSTLLLTAVVVVAFLLQWFRKSPDEKRQFAEDLVRRAQQEMKGKPGEEKLAFVLAEFQKMFPGFPVGVARTFIEAAVNRVKAEEPQVFEVGGNDVGLTQPYTVSYDPQVLPKGH